MLTRCKKDKSKIVSARCTVVQRAVLRSRVVRLSVHHQSVCNVGGLDCGHIGWKSWKLIARPNSLRYLLTLTPTTAIWSNGNIPRNSVNGIGMGSGAQKNLYYDGLIGSCIHPFVWSLILVPIGSAYATSYKSVIVTLVLSCTVSTVSEILQVFLLASPPLFHRNLGVFPLDQIADVGVSPSRNLKLISREIIFEVFQLV